MEYRLWAEEYEAERFRLKAVLHAADFATALVSKGRRLTTTHYIPTLTTAMSNEPAIEKVSLAEKLTHFTDTWSPKIVGEINDAYVKLVKLKGEFVWHHHDNEDEMFLVIKGHLLMRLRDRDLHLDEGEFVIIPRGVEHLPIADDECHVMLLEPKTTLNTGQLTNERTVAELERI